MELQRKIQHYQECLKMYGSMICDLSESESFIIKLIEDNPLDGIETALRKQIELMSIN